MSLMEEEPKICNTTGEFLEALKKDKNRWLGLRVQCVSNNRPQILRPNLIQYPIVRHGDLLAEIALGFEWYRPLKISIGNVSFVSLKGKACTYVPEGQVNLLTQWDPIFMRFELEKDDVQQFIQLIISYGYKLTYMNPPVNERFALVSRG
jgi:hypothetical protein